MLSVVVRGEDGRRHGAGAGQLRVCLEPARRGGRGGSWPEGGRLQVTIFLESFLSRSWGPGSGARPPAISAGAVQAVNSAVRKSLHLEIGLR